MSQRLFRHLDATAVDVLCLLHAITPPAPVGRNAVLPWLFPDASAKARCSTSLAGAGIAAVAVSIAAATLPPPRHQTRARSRSRLGIIPMVVLYCWNTLGP